MSVMKSQISQVIGLDNIVVVNTPNGVLVARKDIAAKTSEITKMLNKKI